MLMFCGLLLTFITSYAQDNVIDEVVWVVGDQPILKSEVEEERIRAQYDGRKFKGDPYSIIPEEIAIQKLFLHQAELDSIEVSESEVIRSVNQRINQYIQYMGSKEKVEETFNKKMSQIRENLRESIRQGMTIQQMKQKLIGEVEITPAQVRRYFAKMSADSIPFIPSKVEIQIITQEPQIPVEEIERVKEQLREYTKRINSGESKFSTLALLYSEDPGSARHGGELGFKSKGTLVPEFAAVAFNLKDPNKISKIVKTEYGYHIIQLIEKRGDLLNCRHILLKPRIADEDLTKSVVRLDSIATEIRNDKFTFGRAALFFSQDKDTHNNHGLMPNPQTGDALFEMQQLPGEIAKQVDKLKIGQISEGFVMTNTKGQEVCAIVKLKNRIDAHKANIRDDFQSIKELVLARLREQKLEKWIKEKQKKTYVRISPNWQKKDFKYPGWIKK